MAEGFSHIDDIIVAFLKGEITPTEKDILRNWIDADRTNKEHFRKSYMIWNSAALLNQDESKVEEALQKTRYRINQIQQASEKEQPAQKTRVLYFLGKWAALILITLTAGFLGGRYYLATNSYSARHRVNSISVPLGSQSTIDLPDGTRVILNAGSKLTYQTNYGENLREVTLIGEGYFKVAKQKNKPFIVYTSKANIRALGTEFNVKAYPDEDVVETILVEGLVEVKGHNKNSKNKITGKNGILVHPGQKIEIYETSVSDSEISVPERTVVKGSNNSSASKTVMELKRSDPEVETSWKENRWIVKGENLKELAKLLSRRYNVTIHIEDQALTRFKFSGIIQNETLEQVFNIMQLTIPVAYSIDRGDVKWTINQKLEKDYKEAYQDN